MFRLPYARGYVSDKTKIREVAVADIFFNIFCMLFTPFYIFGYPEEMVGLCYVFVFGIGIRIIMLTAALYLFVSSPMSKPVEKRIEAAWLWALVSVIFILFGVSTVETFHYFLGYHWTFCFDTVALLPLRMFFLGLTILYLDKLKWQKIVQDEFKGHVTMKEWLKIIDNDNSV